MFRLFQNSKAKEREFLSSILAQLPDEYLFLKNQLHEGLIRNVRYDGDDVSVLFNPLVSKKYEKKQGEYYYLRGLFVFDENAGEFIEVILKIAYGLLIGYFISARKNRKLNNNKLIQDNLWREYKGGDYPEELKSKLTKEEKELVNPNDVYKVELLGRTYFHIIDLEDGDLIGIDEKKVVYKITHDPMEAIKLDKSLEEVLKEFATG